MSKPKVDITDTVMSRIESGQVRMRPRIFFLLGTVAMVVSLASLFFMSVFLVSLISFSLKTHGPMATYHYQQLLSEFPWWAPIVTLVSLFIGIVLLKKYEFSYKRNFLLIVIAFVLSAILAGWAINHFGMDSLWSGQGVMRRLYQQYDGRYQGEHRRIMLEQNGKDFQYPTPRRNRIISN